MRDELEWLLEEQQSEEEQPARVLPSPKTLLVRQERAPVWPRESGSAAQSVAGPEETGSGGGEGFVPAPVSGVTGRGEGESAPGREGAAPPGPAADGEALREPEQAALEPLQTAGAGAGLPLPERRGERAARMLYQALEHGRRAAEYRRRESAGGVRLVRERPWENAPGGTDAGAVDRQFQRDARRYDGGFTWQ